jgi:non-ribosomal peptide synthetase component F
VSLFTTLLAAWATLVSEDGDGDDVAVACPVAGRDRQEIEGLIGPFANTLVLRCDLSGDPSFAGLLSRVHRVATDAFKHRDLPFARLAEELWPERFLRREPAFRAAMVFPDVPASSARIPGLIWRRQPPARAPISGDLTLSLEETSRGLSGSLRYRKASFDAPAIDRLAARSDALLRRVVEAPERRLSELSGLPRTSR